MFNKLISAALVAACLVLPAWAQEETATNVTVITSKKLTFDNKSRYAVFEDDVVVKDPAVTIEADKMTALFEADNRPKLVVAVGNVKIHQPGKSAVCERAVYQVKTGRLDLSGSPVLQWGKDVLKGKVITFWRDENKMEGEDVQLVLHTEDNPELKKLIKE